MLVLDLVTSDETKKFAPATSMALAIIEATLERGKCQTEDLYRKGFAPDEVALHEPMAQLLATVEMQFMNDNQTSLKSIIKRRSIVPKNIKQQNQIKKPRSLYSIHPWECRHNKDNFEIIAYVEASSKWETVATIHPTAGASAETMASFICHLVNENQKNASLLHDAMQALEACMEEADLTFTSEQAADSVVRRIKSRIP